MNGPNYIFGLTITLEYLEYLSSGIQLTPLMVTAVAWAAMLVPLRVFLNPSMPQDRISRRTPESSTYLVKYPGFINGLSEGQPLWSVTEIIVLLGETRMLQMGSSLKGVPLNNWVAVLASGKNLALLWLNKAKYY